MYNRRKSDSKTSCHNEAAKMGEIHTGYLFKSPPSGQIKIMKSWKRRFFVLAKTNDSSHELKYYKTTERGKYIKSIKASTITLLHVGPESHSAFEWISKNFKCSPSSVLFMKAEDPTEKVQREYFFIGDTSEEVDRWFNALFTVLKHIKPEPQSKTASNSMDQNPSDIEETEADSPPPVPPRKKTASEVVTTQHDQCTRPPRSMMVETDVCEKEETLYETAEESNEDMPSGEGGISTSEDSLLDCVTKAFNNFSTQETSTESDRSTTIDRPSSQDLSNARNKNNTKNFNFDLNGNSDSTELNSETHTHVEKEISISHCGLNSVIFTEESGKPCVSKCRQIQASRLFHKGDQILAVNGLLTDTVEEIQTYLRKLNKTEVKLTIRRFQDSIPLHSETF